MVQCENLINVRWSLINKNHSSAYNFSNINEIQFQNSGNLILKKNSINILVSLLKTYLS